MLKLAKKRKTGAKIHTVKEKNNIQQCGVNCLNEDKHDNERQVQID